MRESEREKANDGGGGGGVITYSFHITEYIIKLSQH